MKNNFQLIWINGMPRSGTSWLGEIFNSHPDTKYRLAPLFSYEFKNFVNNNSSRKDWVDFFNKIYNYKSSNFLDQIELRKKKLFPTHVVKNATPNYLILKHTRFHNLTENLIKNIPEIKLFHIIRNPCGVINSWLLASKEFPENSNPLKEWETGSCRKTGPEEFWGYNDWKAVTRLYLKLKSIYPENVFIIRYEDLVNSPKKIIKSAFKFINLPQHHQTDDFLIKSNNTHEDNDYSVYKSKKVKHKWKTQLNHEIKEAIFKDLDNSNLKIFLND